MTVLLSKTRRKETQATVFALSARKNAGIHSTVFDTSTNRLIAQFIVDKSLDTIKAHCLTIAQGNALHTIIICSVGTKPWDGYQLEQWTQAVQKAIEHCQLNTVDIDIASLAHATKTSDINSLVAPVCRLLLHHQYRFSKYKSKSSEQKAASINLISAEYDAATKHEYSVAKAIDEGKTFARDLANMPANECNVDYLVQTAKELAKDKRLRFKCIDEKRMEKRHMGAFLAVTKGSSQQGALIILEYRGGKDKDPVQALIGKGLVFDTGGISLKPAAGMEEMKYDMCGAASVLGTCKAILALKPKINVVFAIAAAENMPSGEATRPGDIVKTSEGLTVEILNTDAEGRLVLCDAISYVKKQYKPHHMIDIATLTGACVIALGHHASAMYTNDTQLSDKLQQAAQISNDKIWPMPLWQEYQDQLSSNIADLPNISGGRDAGSVTAACFLSRFAGDSSWAHLDIAGTSWVSGKNKQSTGRPTALLTHFLLQEK